MELGLQLLCFFFTDTATTEIYTLSLHDALPISLARIPGELSAYPLELTDDGHALLFTFDARRPETGIAALRSEEHTSELQSHVNLVCRLLLEKKKKNRR